MNAIVEQEPRARRIPLPARGGEMALLDFGPAARPVDIVFSHANGFNARTYRTILAPLARELRILALDLRGHGASTLPAVIEGRIGWREFAGDLLALLAETVAGPVVLAGHSMGATSSLLAAAEEPGVARSLVLFEPVLFDAATSDEPRYETPLAQGALRRRANFPSRAAAMEAYRGRGAFRSWSEAQLADYVAAGFRDTPEGEVTLACGPAWEASNFATHRYDPWAAFAATRCPIRLIAAEEGSTAAGNSARLEALAADPRITIETAPGTSHFLPMERPDLVRAALRAAAVA